MEYTCIIVIDKQKKNALFCKRVKPPFANLLNFVGGKIEKNESPLASAYRELQEETGIDKKNIKLKKLFNLYPYEGITLHVSYGVLLNDVKLIKEFQDLYWIDINNNDFANPKKYAGEGNIELMINKVKEIIF